MIQEAANLNIPILMKKNETVVYKLSASLSQKDGRPRLFYGDTYSISCKNSSTI